MCSLSSPRCSNHICDFSTGQGPNPQKQAHLCRPKQRAAVLTDPFWKPAWEEDSKGWWRPCRGADWRGGTLVWRGFQFFYHMTWLGLIHQTFCPCWHTMQSVSGGASTSWIHGNTLAWQCQPVYWISSISVAVPPPVWWWDLKRYGTRNSGPWKYLPVKRRNESIYKPPNFWGVSSRSTVGGFTNLWGWPVMEIDHWWIGSCIQEINLFDKQKKGRIVGRCVLFALFTSSKCPFAF